MLLPIVLLTGLSPMHPEGRTGTYRISPESRHGLIARAYHRDLGD